MSTSGWTASFAAEPERPLTGFGGPTTVGGLTTVAAFTTTLFSSDNAVHRQAKEERAKQRLRNHLQSQRTGRLGPAVSIDNPPVGSTDAYDTRCLNANSLPCCSTVQVLAGDAGKAGKRRASAEQDKAKDESSLEGVMLGLPTLEEAGWRRPGDPVETQEMRHGVTQSLDAQDDRGLERRATSKLTPEVDLKEEHHATAMHCLGLTPVARYVGSVTTPGRLLTFRKADVPSSTHEVKTLLHALQKLAHLNAVQLLQACESEEHLYLVYEDCLGAGHLVLRVSTNKLLSATEAALLLHELASVMACCEKHRLSVLEWSIWNVMSPDFTALSPAKVFGIGLAGVLYDGEDCCAEGALPSTSPQRSSFRFRPPELIRTLKNNQARPYQGLELKERRSVDAWSFAAIVFHCLEGKAPFSGGTAEEVHAFALEVQAVNVRTRLEGLPADAIVLIERCMHVTPAARPTASEVLACPWVTTEVYRSRGGNIDAIIDRLACFVERHTIMRALGKLMMEVLKPEKEKSIEAMFRSVDADGTGEISCQELIALAGHRRDEVKAIFRQLSGGDGEGASIGLTDFSHANVFADGIVTHRMLFEAFNVMDDDRSGCISAVELFEALHELDDALTWADVCGFIKGADVDCYIQLTFEEFCKYFPNAKLVDECGARRRTVADLLHACQLTSAALLQHVDGWAAKMGRVHRRLMKVESDNKEFESAGSMKVCSKLYRVLGEARQLVASLPVVSIPSEAHQVMGKRSVVGIPLLDEFMRQRKESWLAKVGSLQQAANETVEEEQGFVRRYEVDRVCRQSMALVKEMLDWIKSYSEEQADSLEASGELEGTCPNRPWSRRAIASVNKERAGIEELGIMATDKKATRSVSTKTPQRKVTVQRLLQKLGASLQAGGWSCAQVFKAS